ncbi:alpha/beta hydrolase [uncultured Thiohalocapsa sp.]|uniref:alpha/beta fold hydrolase n=1 Tax=uncultured Thiohalocapsa sp. TaxID=768990 RepID=UPI0025D8182A|nr:alpha/beta hydrolase [uncultured Thiohalocapsa sp.]
MGSALFPGHALHYLQLPGQRSGEAAHEHLLLVHGLAANLAFWNAGIALPLSRRFHFHVLAYDLRGHGRSTVTPCGYSLEHQASDLEALLDHLRLDRVHVLSHSYGGAVATLFALRQPERVASLMLADVRLRALQPTQRLCDWAYWPQWRGRLERLGARLDPQLPEGGFNLLCELARLHLLHPQGGRLLPALFAAPPRARTKAGNTAQHWLDLVSRTSLFREFCYPDSITEERLRALRVPVLALYGAHSNTLPTAQALARLCADCELQVLPEVGHFFPMSHPKLLLRAVSGFLRRRLGLGGADAGQPDGDADQASEGPSPA